MTVLTQERLEVQIVSDRPEQTQDCETRKLHSLKNLLSKQPFVHMPIASTGAPMVQLTHPHSVHDYHFQQQDFESFSTFISRLFTKIPINGSISHACNSYSTTHRCTARKQVTM